MTVGDIRAQALHLMGEEDGRDIRGEDVEDLLNRGGEIRRLLLSMPGSIDRALSLIEGRLLTVLQSVTLSETNAQNEGYMRRYTLPDTVYSPLSVSSQGSGLPGAVPFIREGGSILLPPPEMGESYLLWYYPRLPRMSGGLDNTTDLEASGVPRLCAGAIPYFIKGELYEREEPEAAALAFQRFETMLDVYADSTLPGSSGGSENNHSGFSSACGASSMLDTAGQERVRAIFEVSI